MNKQQPDKNKKYFAAIDLGTNSCRLLIADEDKNYVYADAVSTRMGEGMYPEMRFTPEAVERGCACFCDFRRVMDEYGVISYRAISTASCRMAQNAQEFLDRVSNEASIKIDVVDGYEEARLNLKGALQHVCGKSRYVVVYDLGGGSTEITLATNESNPKIIHTISIPWGARNATEAFELQAYDDIKAQKLVAEIRKYTEKFVEDSGLKNCVEDVCFVATSSTPLRFVSMVEKFGYYDRGLADGRKVLCSDIDREIDGILKMSQEEKAENPYIGEKRAVIFAAACLIFKAIYDTLQAKELTASLKSAKDGIVEELIDDYLNKGLIYNG